jgi:hypothetical protein
MGSRGRRPASVSCAALAVAIMAAGALIGSAMVSAHSPAGKSVLGSSHGLTYVGEQATLPNAPPYNAAATAACPKHTAGTGGGAFVSGPTAGAWLNSSSPEPAGSQATPKKGWIAYAAGSNQQTADQTLNVYAICSDQPSKLEYVHKAVTVPSDPPYDASATAACPKHTAVTGGGAFISGAAGNSWINSSSPEPAASTKATPNKGWIAYAENTSITDHNLDVYAICSHRTSKLKYVHKTATLPASGSFDTSRIAECPKHTAVVGGGAFVSGDSDSFDAWINSSSPEPAGSQATPKKGWIAYAFNNGTTEQTLHVYAICTK